MDYKILIRDEIQELQSLEKQQSKGQFRDYVRFLRLLKSGECSSQAKAAQQVNLGVRQAQRVWKTYRQHGLEGLLQSKNKGYFGKISFVEVSHLRRYLLDDQAYTLGPNTGPAGAAGARLAVWARAGMDGKDKSRHNAGGGREMGIVREMSGV